MDAASRPMAQEVFIGISRSRWSANSAFKTRDSARALRVLARVLCWYQSYRLCSEIELCCVSDFLTLSSAQWACKAVRCAIGLKRNKSFFISNYLRREHTMAKTPSNHGKDWTAGDIKKLGQLARQNTPTRVAALKLGRTSDAVAQKASVEGISLKPTNQRPYGTRKK